MYVYEYPFKRKSYPVETKMGKMYKTFPFRENVNSCLAVHNRISQVLRAGDKNTSYLDTHTK